MDLKEFVEQHKAKAVPMQTGGSLIQQFKERQLATTTHQQTWKAMPDNKVGFEIEGVKLPYTELRAIKPEERFITETELMKERKETDAKTFSQKYSPDIAFYIEEELGEEKRLKKGGIYYGGHEKVPAEEWIRRGISFRWAPGLPIEKPETLKEKMLEGAGKVVSMVVASKILSPVLGGIISKIPGVAKPLAKITAEVAKHPWKVGWPLAGVKGGLWGALFGAIEKAENKTEWAKNVAETAGTFAAFNIIAYPIIQFFRPIVYELGKDVKYRADPNVRKMLTTSEGTEYITKGPDTLWFKHPTDPNVVLKVTQKSISVVSVKEAPLSIKAYPVFGKTEIEAFHYEPSLYAKLKAFLTKSKPFFAPIPKAPIPGPTALIPSPAPPVTPTPPTISVPPIIPSPITPTPPTAPPVPEVVAKPVPGVKPVLPVVEPEVIAPKKGETIQIKSIETGKTEPVEFVSQRDDGIMAIGKGVDFPMLFRDTKWEIVKPEIKPEITPTIPKELEQSIREAKTKGLSVEEFVEAKATLMRGAKTAEIKPGEVGVYLTSDRKMAEVFAGEEGVVTKAFANVEKTYNISKASEFEWLDALIENPRDYSRFIDELKVKGYDSILSSDKKQLLVFDRNKVFTKSQLTDFYQALRGVKEVRAEVPVKPKIETKISIIDEGKRAEEQAEILLQLEIAEKGERIHWEEYDGTPHTIGVDSSFPKWIPDKLRSRKLFDAVLKHIKNDTLPKKADEVRLYNVVAEQLGLKEVIKSISQEEEIDVSKLFEDEKINDQISKISSAKEGEVGKDIAERITEEKEIKIEKPKPEIPKELEVGVGFEERWNKLVNEIQGYVSKKDYTIKDEGIEHTFAGEKIFIPKDLAKKVYTIYKTYIPPLQDLQKGQPIEYKKYAIEYEDTIARINKKADGKISSITTGQGNKIQLRDIVVDKGITIEDIVDAYRQVFIFPSSYSKYTLDYAKKILPLEKAIPAIKGVKEVKPAITKPTEIPQELQPLDQQRKSFDLALKGEKPLSSIYSTDKDAIQKLFNYYTPLAEKTGKEIFVESIGKGLYGMYIYDLRRASEILKKYPIKAFEEFGDKAKVKQFIRLAESETFAKGTPLEKAISELYQTSRITQAVKGAKEVKPKAEKPKGVPSATIGKFRKDTEVKLGNVDKIKPVEFPELVEIAKDLMGRVPVISKRLRKSLGKFYAQERGRIKLNPEIFKKENSNQLAKTLAHEIGHLVDYLPQQTLKRGNLLGSLLSLRRFLKNTYGEAWVTNIEIRDELKTVSKYWRPWEEKTATQSYKNYRNSSRELYADAVSVLFNSPGTLGQKAPVFYESFFKYLDKKPEVKNAYFNLQEVLSHDRATLIQLRRERVKEMFDKADYKSKELQDIKEKERKVRLKDFWEMFTYGIKSINQPVYSKVRNLQKRGVYIPDEMNPEYLLSGRNYLSGLVKGEFKENVQPIMKDLFKNDIDWPAFGEFLYYERIIAGDRSEFANPRGITQKAAEELRDSIKQSLGERYKVLEENADKFRSFLKKWATEAYKEGMFREETFDIIKGNEKYVPFQVLEYMENYVAWKTKPQVGTLKDIANPANSLLLKVVSTIRAIENQKDRMATFKMLEQGYPDEIKEADLQFTGKAQRPIPSRDSNFEMVTYYKEGKLRGKYIDPYIAKSLEKDTIAANRAVMTILSPVKYLNQKLFRPIFVVYNPGWIPFNFIRDFTRFWKNTPGMTMYRALKLYGKAWRPAKVRVWGLKKGAKEADIKAEELVTKLEKEKVLLVTWNDFLMGQTTEDVQVETIFKDMGLMESKREIPAITKWFEKILKYTGIRPILEWIRKTGSIIETLPKVAGYFELEGKMPPQEMRTFIRRNVGSPDFFEKGYLTAATNDIFLFSNAFVQAVSADADIAISPKTRSGFWWKTAKTIFLPKLLMFLAIIGAFGTAIKKVMEDASEYDLTNYMVVPLGRDSKNGKTIYLRIPTDETSRLLGGVLWKGMYAFKNDQNFMRDMADIASLFGGQLPGLSPAIEAPLTTAQFLRGKNPYDSFRGRTVLTEQEAKAGGWYAAKPFLLWQFQQIGGNIFMKMYAGERTPTEKSVGEKLLQSPVISNVIGRFLKISDYGAIEKYREKLSEVQQEQARKSIDENKVLNDYVKKYQKGEGSETELGIKLVEDILGHYPPRGSEEAEKKNRIKKKFRIAILKGKADPVVNSFISAYTNEEKLTLLKVFEEDMTESEFSELRKTLLQYKIVSQEVFGKLRQLK